MRLHLAPGEQVILRERPSGHSLVWPLVRAGAVSVVLGALASQLKPLLASAESAAGSGVSMLLTGVLLAVGLWVLFAVGLRRVFQWLSTVYLLTDERLILRSGLGGRREDSVPLPAIYRVDIRTPWHQRATSSGTLRFTVAQGSEFSVHDVPNAPVFRAEVIDAISKAQQRHWHIPREDHR